MDKSKEEHFVYLHKRLSNGEVFYVGMGKNVRHLDGGRSRPQAWYDVVEKEKGFSFEYYIKDVSEEKARMFELEQIHKIGYANLTNSKQGKPNRLIHYKDQTFNTVQEAADELGVSKSYVQKRCFEEKDEFKYG